MGWLTDIGNIAVGAIERDREITKEDLIIRADNLKANQKLLIDQKKKMYDKELAAYYEEKKKFDNIERMNKLFDDKAIDARTYAGFALTQEIPNFDMLPPKTKERMIANYKGETFGYELIGSADEINKKAANAITLINDETAAAIKNAKGNSFLINKILRKKEKVEKDIYASIEAQLKAADAVKMTSQSTNKDYVGKEVKVSDGTGFSSILKHNDGKWLTQFNSAVTGSEYKGITIEPMILDVVAGGAVKGFNTGPFIKKNADGEVTGWTNNGQGLQSYMSSTYKTLHDNLADKNAIIESYNYNDVIGGANINASKLIDKSLSILNQRAKVFKVDDGPSVFAAIPVGVINENNQFIFDGQGFNLDGKQMHKAMQLYENFVEAQTIKNVEGKGNIFGNVTNTTWVNAWNELQINMNSNRNFVKGGRETNFAYEFKKMLVNELALEVPIEPDEFKKLTAGETEIAPDKKIIEDEKVVTVDKEEILSPNEIRKAKKKEKKGLQEEKKKIDTSKPYVKDNTVYFTIKGEDQEILFENLDESQVNELKIKYPDIYKEYETWLNNTSINKDNIATDTFTTNTNKMKNMILESEKEILSGQKKKNQKDKIKQGG